MYWIHFIPIVFHINNYNFFFSSINCIVCNWYSFWFFVQTTSNSPVAFSQNIYYYILYRYILLFLEKEKNTPRRKNQYCILYRVYPAGKLVFFILIFWCFFTILYNITYIIFIHINVQLFYTSVLKHWYLKNFTKLILWNLK